MPFLNWFNTIPRGILVNGIWRDSSETSKGSPIPQMDILSTEDNKGILTEDGNVLVLETSSISPVNSLTMMVNEAEDAILITENNSILLTEG